jgi:hypothetical protein
VLDGAGGTAGGGGAGWGRRSRWERNAMEDDDAGKAIQIEEGTIVNLHVFHLVGKSPKRLTF